MYQCSVQGVVIGGIRTVFKYNLFLSSGDQEGYTAFYRTETEFVLDIIFLILNSVKKIMFELSEEKILMTSSDNSVRLTSHRIICESEGKREQVMLEDFESYELKNRSIGAYDFLLWFIISVTVLIIFNKIKNYYDNRQFLRRIGIDTHFGLWDIFREDMALLVLLFVLIIVHIFYLISRRYIIKINGKYNSFEFRVKSFRNKSVQRMLDKLTNQSKIVKKKSGRTE